ncbi:MAG: T9SS type A sorting domain-containing protein [Tannerella sp.]|nr:T9SS type A sorting domain-containing protein [Tannerella sp.]
MVNDAAPEIKVSLADGLLHIISEEDTPFDVVVYDMRGIPAARKNGNLHTALLPLSGMPQNVYIVRVTSGAYVYTRKVVR